jgi:hypothetical protein
MYAGASRSTIGGARPLQRLLASALAAPARWCAVAYATCPRTSATRAVADVLAGRDDVVPS